jgi:hypothetical protein
VSAKVIVILENQDTRFVAGGYVKKVRGGEAADASPYDYQIIGFASVHGLGSIVPKDAVANFVHGFEGADMAPTKTRFGWRIVAGEILRL